MIWSVQPNKITSITVSTPKDSYEIIRSDNDWLVRGASAEKLDKGKMAELIAQLSAMRARGFAAKNDPHAAFKKPAFTLALALDDGKAEVLEVAGRNNLGQAYARRKGDEQVYLVNSPDTLVPKDWKSLR